MGVGGRPQNARAFLPVGGSGHPSFGIVDVGGDPIDGPHPGYFPPQGGNKVVWDATVDMDGWDLGIYPSGRCPTDGGAGDNGDVHLQIPEYSRTVHCDATDS